MSWPVSVELKVDDQQPNGISQGQGGRWDIYLLILIQKESLKTKISLF